MLETRLASNGPVCQTSEQLVATFPAGAGGTVQALDIPIKSRLPPGSATYVQITQHDPTFLLLHSDITSPGQLHLHLYYIIDQLAPADFDCHVVVFAHEQDML